MSNQVKEIKRDSIKKSSIFNISIKLLTFLIPLILSPYLYRTLNFEGMGTYEYQYSYVTYFSLIANFGFDTYGTKIISQSASKPELLNKRFWSILYAKLTLGCISLLAYFSFVFAGVFGNSSTYVSYTILSMFIVSTMTDISFFYQGIEKFQGIALRTGFIKILNLVLIFIFIKSPSDYLLYVLIMSGSYLLASLIMFLPLKKYITKPTFSKSLIVLDIKKASAFFITALAISLYTTMQKTILGLLTNDTEVGYFSSAIKIKDVVTSLSYAIVTVFYSRISFLLSEGKKEESIQLIYKLFNIVYDITLPACIGLICVSEVFMPLYFGSGGTNAVNMLIYSSFSIPIIGMSSIITNAYLLPSNKLRKTNIIYLCTSVFNLAISYVLIKNFGGNGAAIAVTLTELFATLFNIYYSKKDINYTTALDRGSKAFSASLIMGICYFFINKLLTRFISANKSMLIMIIISVLIYYFLMLLFKDDIIFGYSKLIFIKLKGKLQKKQK